MCNNDKTLVWLFDRGFSVWPQLAAAAFLWHGAMSQDVKSNQKKKVVILQNKAEEGAGSLQKFLEKHGVHVEILKPSEIKLSSAEGCDALVVLGTESAPSLFRSFVLCTDVCVRLLVRSFVCFACLQPLLKGKAS